VHALLSVYAYFRYAFRLTSTAPQDALIAARNSVGLCPLLCTLFLGCRLRALQITEQRGHPQWWQQDFLYVCVGATLLEVICCLAMPLFFKEVGVDDKGDLTWEIQSLTSAYAVTVVRYMALISLHGGVLFVCAAILSMTPETALAARRPGDGIFGLSLARAALWVLFALLIAAVLSSAKVVGIAVKWAVESVDEVLLNAEISVGTAVLHLWRGHIIIKGLLVRNPSGYSFKSGYLIKADFMAVKLDVWRLLVSRGRSLMIRELIISGVEVNFEKGQAGGPSNVRAVLDFLAAVPKRTQECATERTIEPALPPAPCDAPSNAPDVVPMMLCCCCCRIRGGDPGEKEAAKGGVSLRRLFIKGVQGKVVHTGGGILASVDLGTMDFPDFSEVASGHRIRDIVIFVLQIFLRNAMTNGQIIASLFGHSTSEALLSLMGGCRACGAGALRLATGANPTGAGERLLSGGAGCLDGLRPRPAG